MHIGILQGLGFFFVRTYIYGLRDVRQKCFGQMSETLTAIVKNLSDKCPKGF